MGLQFFYKHDNVRINIIYATPVSILLEVEQDGPRGQKYGRGGSDGADGGGVQLAVRKDAADPRVFHFPSRATLVTPIFPVSQVAVLVSSGMTA